MFMMEMEKSYNQHVSHLPKHLLEYVVDQNYKHYTPIDQAVWRYVMRQNVNYLPSVCHGSYLEGLKKTGLAIESIPSMYGMSRILKDIGWYAVAVDGFIPPTIFMEFQAHNVLVIAADIRQINHIGYTPAPDILHEAAGHAPIIADIEYAEYLKKFGEIGSKAFSSSDDMVLFEAIRELSILKEAPQIDKSLVQKAEEKVLNLQSNISSLSEMAKIRNLHWWTVEYGLIGSINNPKIYGAGLLSSISESVNCLSDKVPKLPYSIDSSLVTFDITKEQPQLFVAEDFNHLQSVLNEFSNNMAFKKGGDYSVSLAIEYSSIATCEFDSGVQVSGVFKELIKRNNKGIYLKTEGPTALSINNKQLRNHGVEHHVDGFGAPIGEIINVNDINSLRQKLNQEVKLIYDSGIIVQGVLFDLVENENGDIIILSFNLCSVVLNEDGLNQKQLILFDPSWGVFDLVLGARIISAYPNAADIESFPVEKIQFKSQTIQPKFTKSEQKLHELYSLIRHMRETSINSDELSTILNQLINEYQDDWLLTLEICELAKNKYKDIYDLAYNHLMNIKKSNLKYEKLIFDGLNLLS